MSKYYLYILRLSFTICMISLCIFNKSPVININTLKCNNTLLLYTVSLISLILTIIYLIILNIRYNIRNILILIILILSHIFMIITCIITSSYITILCILLCIPLDGIILSINKKKQEIIGYKKQGKDMVYMKRNIVQGREVVLHMGEFVQTINDENDGFILVRKFNGEEFNVKVDDIVENVEDVIGEV